MNARKCGMLGALLSLTAGGVFLGSGCELIAGLDGDYKLEDQFAACKPIHPPDRSEAMDPGGDLTFTVAVRKIGLDEEDELATLGFDLDNACTCTTHEATCARPAWANKKRVVCDDARGIDNGVGVALGRVGTLAAGTVSSDLINGAAEIGDWSQLIRVRGYSGTPDDPEVELAFFETPGMDGTGVTPKWDGNDTWPVAETSVDPVTKSLEYPVFVDKKAYVRGNILVAHLPKLPVVFRGALLKMALSIESVTISAKIATDSAGRYVLREGTTAAKWPLSKMFETLSSLRYNGNKKLCRNDTAYYAVKASFCDSVDILLDSSSMSSSSSGAPDAGSPECDAVSYGAYFEAYPAHLGQIVPPLQPLDDGCSKDEDPIKDSCSGKP